MLPLNIQVHWEQSHKNVSCNIPKQMKYEFPSCFYLSKVIQQNVTLEAWPITLKNVQVSCFNIFAGFKFLYTFFTIQ
jgi:hypothetical protein